MTLLAFALPRRNAGPAFSLTDGMILAGLGLLLFVLLVYRSDALPLMYWDESRIANNALEAARGGHWLAPFYHGAVDHWNTKPPLLVWAMAGFLKVGLPPLWAVRLPSILAVAATCGLAWATLRFVLKDAVAAAVCGALILCSSLYVGFHGARTGDFDGPEALFVLGYVISVWAAFANPPKPNWLFAAAACIFGAVLTKGVAGAIPLPGCALYLLSDRVRFVALIKDSRTWICGLAAAVLCVGYYLGREIYDPGYIRAVLFNELGGRFLAVSDGHSGGPFFYLDALFHGFQPGVVLLPLAVLPLFGAHRRRRDLTLVTLASGAVLLGVLSWSKTKLFWYETPAIPLFSIAAAIGVSDALHHLTARNPARGRRAAVVVAVLIVAGGAATVWAEYACYANPQWTDELPSQVRDGTFLAYLHGKGVNAPVTVVDDRFFKGTEFSGAPPNRYYNQAVDFYARLYGGQWRIDQLAPGEILRPPSMAVACSPAALAWITGRYSLAIVAHAHGCVLGRALAERPPSGAGTRAPYRPAIGMLTAAERDSPI